MGFEGGLGPITQAMKAAVTNALVWAEQNVGKFGMLM